MAAWPRMVEMGGDISSIRDLLQRQSQQCCRMVRSSASEVTPSLNPPPSTGCSAGFRKVASETSRVCIVALGSWEGCLTPLPPFPPYISLLFPK